MKSTHARRGTYRGHPVFHYYNKETNLNVMVNPDTNKFISGWYLGREQRDYMVLNGNIQ